MSVIEKRLKDRSGNKCELCNYELDLAVFAVEPLTGNELETEHVLACPTCINQLNNPEEVDPNHWRCLTDSMWNENIPVQVVAWRMLTRLRAEGWPQDLVEMMYFDDETLEYAKATGEGESNEDGIIHKDCNGTVLKDGDSVVLIKDLDVKGANFTAKRGAAVHRISLVWDNAEHIEGRLENQNIVILTQYVKKTK